MGFRKNNAKRKNHKASASVILGKPAEQIKNGRNQSRK